MSRKNKIWYALSGIAVGCVVYLIFHLSDSKIVEDEPQGDSPSSLPSALGPELLEKARNATVFIQGTGASYVDDTKVSEGSGTGFFISSDGRIATNWHVISFNRDLSGLPIALRTKDLKVVIHSGTDRQKALPARILAANPRADLAILKVQMQGCEFLTINDTKAIRETTPVSILGFPFGNLFTVLQRGPEISINQGFITSLRHDDRGNLERIQFDAAVNRGNSGGPLVLPDGQVCGIANIAIGTSRVNFAVPARKNHFPVTGVPGRCRGG